jgi:hypothetical protein
VAAQACAAGIGRLLQIAGRHRVYLPGIGERGGTVTALPAARLLDARI